jgi:death on curing protein
VKSSPAFLSVEHVLAIHRRMIDEFGGDSGARDHGLLESAVMMPRVSFGGRFLHKSVAAMAAAYLFHLCKNHPFIDGNKRTALGAVEVFLALNGFKFEATDSECVEWTLDVVKGVMDKGQLTRLFYQRVTRVQ